MKSIKELHDEEQADARNAEAFGRFNRSMDMLDEGHRQWQQKFAWRQKWITSVPLIVMAVWIVAVIVVVVWKLL